MVMQLFKIDFTVILILIVSIIGNHQTVHNMPKSIQLTKDVSGHYLNVDQCFSPDGDWLVYDVRNDGTQIGSSGGIYMVNIHNGLIKELYQTKNQTAYGPGVGAVSFSPKQNRVIFIHGIRNANQEKPYSFSRRTGVAIDVKLPNKPIFMDARHIQAPFTKGALRGGTHAHSWSGDGKWLSFTYNDYLLEKLSYSNKNKDLRTVGVMIPQKVKVKDVEDLENNDGEMFSVIIAKVIIDPSPGSDEIDKAFDECWIGTNGYINKDGKQINKAIAFQGNVRDKDGKIKTEIFVVDLNSDLTKSDPEKPIEGTNETLPNPPAGVQQKRISFTKNGILGPRHWLKSSPDGRIITFLSKDDEGFINAFAISPNGGAISQLTHHKFDLQSGVNFNPDGTKIAYIADNNVFITNIRTNKSEKLTQISTDEEPITGCAIWSPNGNKIAYNKYVKSGSEAFVQIFLIDLT